MVTFDVVGPFQVPLERRPGYFVRRSGLEEFWKECGCRDDIGCYVFAVRSSGGAAMYPYYVGKSAKSFGQECFSPTKMLKYVHVLAQFKKAKAFLFLVRPSIHRGPRNRKAIAQLEKHLIEVAFQRNPELENVQNTPKADLQIRGVLNHHARGTPTLSARSFKNTMGLQ
jgi:hypothetical protein